MRFSVCPAAAFLITATAFGQNASTPTPPVAEKIHKERQINGAVLVDDYGWLRERTNPKVRAYLEAENAYAEQVTAEEKPFAERLYNETLSHIKQTDTSVPYRKHGYWYYTRTEEGKQYPILCRKKETLTAPEQVMLDVNQLAQGEKFMSLGAREVSDDSNLLAFTTDNVGFRQYKLHVKDLRTGKLLPDTAERVDSLTWAADNKTLLYSTEDAQTKRSNLVHRHVLGTDSASDPVVFDEKDERYGVYVDRSRDGKYLLMQFESHVTSEIKFLAANSPTGNWTVLEPRKEGVRYYADEGNGTFYIRVNDTDPSYRLVTAPVTNPGKQSWTELIAARKDVPIEDIDVFKDFYVVTERIKGLPVLQVVTIKNKDTHAVEVPEPAYSLSSAMNSEFDTDKFRYNYQSPITPSSTFAYDVKTRVSTLLKQQEVPGFDKSQYAVERLFVPARDGVGVPTTVVYRKDKFKRGENPLFVYGYGSYGITIPDTFSATQLPLLDRGVVTSVAHIRGGGELGEAWHDAGKMMTKRHTFTDFIDATEGLLAQGYGKRGDVGIEGASAGGLLMGAVTNMRPDLFKVVLCEVPFVDVMNTMLDASLPLTVPEYEEWGNPNQKAAFDYMLTYSPYDNVTAKAYPAILVQTSFDDSQVMYWEPSKYVAKLRAVNTNSNSLVFFINMHGGHGGSSGRYDRIREADRRYAFMLTQLGITQ
ncbi:MAG TPA: S9 family peptidase [Silvibacterium sp.]|nr:S9 family peptidase [Silvibacterium sp.]